ncbi:MAG: TonB-dependent receptor [Elusimicrobia bacterium]|nr:TonB-dependent receptor [Elusimicrobiota bacterium]
MKNKIIALLLPILCLTYAYSQESSKDVFLSLTRRAESMRQMPTSVSVIGNERIKNTKARDLGELVDSELGLVRSKYGSLGASSTLSIRGSTAEQVLILIDGRRANSISSGDTNLSAIPLDSVERVEIIRGSASAIYGTNAMGGIVNIITKGYDENMPKIDFGASAGSYGERNFKLHLNLKKDRLYGVAIAGNEAGNGWRENSAFESQNFFARLGYDLVKYGNLELSSSLYSNELGVPGKLFTTTYLPLSVDMYDGTLETKASSPDAIQKTVKKSIKLEHKKTIPYGSLSTVIHSSDESMKYKNPSSFLDGQYDSGVFGLESKYMMDSGFTVGGEWWEERYKKTNLLADSVDVNRSRVNSSGYAQYKLGLNKFVILPSIRFDDNSAFGSVFTPQLGVVYLVSEAGKISLNAGKSWRAPTFDTLYWPVETSVYSGVTCVTKGNASLKPEQGMGYDAGFEIESAKFGTGVTFFNSETKDLIIWLPDYNSATNTETWTPMNVSNTMSTGAEMNLSHKISSSLVQEIAYTYDWSEDADKKAVLFYRPRNIVKYSIKYITVFGLKADADLKYTGSQKTDNQTIDELKEYYLLDLKISQKFKDTEIWIKAENLTDTKYQTRLGFPLAGAAFYAGFEMKFWG